MMFSFNLPFQISDVLPSYDLSSNGYINIYGLKIQWFYFSIGYQAIYNYSYPIAFENTPFFSTMTSSRADNWGVGAQNIFVPASNTYGQIYMQHGAGQKGYAVAIGV